VEGFGKIVINGLEGLLEFLAGDQIEFGDGLVRVGDGLQQVVAFAREEGEALLALIELFECHHVDGAHRFDALLHLAVIHFRCSKRFAAHEGGFGGDQILGLCVDLRHAGFAEMLAVRIIPRTIHFRVAALFAKLLKRLTAHSQMIFHLCYARATAFPFLLQLALADFEAEFFAAEAFELLREIFALLGERSGFISNGGLLLQKSGFATIQFRALFF